MATKRLKRQAATSKGTLRRIEDARLREVSDPRNPKRVRFPLHGVFSLIVGGIASGAKSLRMIESRSEQMGCAERGVLGLPDERIADNTLAATLRVASSKELRPCLHRQVKAEHRRGRLAPVRFKDELRVAAIDGKVLSTLWWRDLASATREVLAETREAARAPGFVPTVDDVRAVFASRFPDVQLHTRDNGELHGLLRTHRTTLVSSEAAVCMDIRPIPAETNEVGAMPKVLDDLRSCYGRTGMIDLITADAGNTSVAVAEQIISYGWDYFLCIKSPHGDLYREAERLLAGHGSPAPVARTTERRDGCLVVHEIRRVALPKGYLKWTHARQLVRVVRTLTSNPSEVTSGERYYVCSLTQHGLTPNDAARLSRYHWRCENEGHWTSDTILDEDARRTVGSRHPFGLLNFATLRMIAQNIMAVLRATSNDGNNKRPPWALVCEHILKTLFPHTIEAKSYDDVEDTAFVA